MTSDTGPGDPDPTAELPADNQEPTVELPADSGEATTELPVQDPKPTVELPAEEPRPTVELPAGEQAQDEPDGQVDGPDGRVGEPDGRVQDEPGGTAPVEDTEPASEPGPAGAGDLGGGTPGAPDDPEDGGFGGNGGWAAGGFAARYRLVRPRGGSGQRKVVGVCAALGQATNTDPVLWRVLLAILAFFGGIGVLLYALGWLIIPQEGDQASPVEALFGRGRSSTSPIVTILLCVLAVLLAFTSLHMSFWSPVLLAGMAVGVVVLLGRRSGRAPAGGTAGSATGTAGAAGFSVPPTGASNPAYRAPFAPHGPYQSPTSAAYQDTREYPLAGRDPDPWTAATGSRPMPPPPPPPPPPPVLNRPRPPRQRSPLGRYTFFALCLALGGLAVLAVTGLARPAPSAFVALGLGVVGVGLLVGAFLGRARGLIALGIVLAVAMPPALIGETVPWQQVRSDVARNRDFDDQTWHPASLAEVQPTYRTSLGNGTLDLSKVDFTGHDTTVNLSAGAGNVTVVLPPEVDTTVTVHNGMGNVTLFGQEQPHPYRDGDQAITNLGPDGKGGGTLTLLINAGMGNVEVSRS